MTTTSNTDPWLAAAGGATPAAFAGLRSRGRDAFAAAGFPTTRDEEWKYTNLAELSRAVVESGTGKGTAAAASARGTGLGGSCLVFVDGAWSAELSDAGANAPGVVVSRLADAVTATPELVSVHLGSRVDLDSRPLAALNTAHLDDGVFVFVPRQVAVAAPIEIVFHVASQRPIVTHPRVLVVLEAGASATVVERFSGVDDTGYFTNAVTEIVLGADASLRHLRAQEDGTGAWHVGSVSAHQAASSRLLSSSISLGARLARIDVHSVLDGAGAECDFDGLYVARNRQHVDHHTVIDHRSPHASSRELYKGVLDDAATGVFNGKVFVRPDAQKSDARQMNKNLLLSDAATVNTKPQLEIFADDVKCSHGATIGRLDAAALFYLRSRGIDAQRAREILVYAFANEMIDRIPLEPLRADLERSLGARFAAAPAQAAA